MARRVSPHKGFTLTEMVVVVAILAALATWLVPALTPEVQVGKNAPLKSPQQVVTEVAMARLRESIAGTVGRPGYWNDILSYSGDTSPTPATLKDLFIVNPTLPASLQSFDPTIQRGWRGPYFLNETGLYMVNAARGFLAGGPTSTPPGYGQAGDPAMLDGWGNPIIIQWPSGTDPNNNPAGHFVRLVSAGPNGVLDTSPSDLYLPNRPQNGNDDLVLYLRRADQPNGPQ